MNIGPKELCPHCLDIMGVTEEENLIREDAGCMVKQVVRHCRSCNQELAKTVKVSFKPRIG
jgi:hypothetical protein